ncbi:hypothetical protein CAOG_08321 [Capsaspora owczarzaki ATCC 30864]|uniref:hypothetical protein n=1 Tax=Capsaspora owczarzaki (strain ATCC 30864) TaxID=595528 RepID=UPI0001FE2C70|nr:hypothetical protein CAOG_08321 [Capsaspora owczarzaki ATCC 30864]|eukprot:XP_004341256.1 hypothetical protein CAOG_08321 [Capsaspora owczarzaki ATCC 30864]
MKFATFYDTDYGWYHLFTMDNSNWESADVGTEVQCWFKGFESEHDNKKEDRWWKYRRSCITHSGEQITKGNTPDEYYFQMNDWDQDFSWTAGQGRTIYGMNSRHWNTKEDRLYQVKTVQMIPEFEYTGGCSTTAEVNNYDDRLDYTCPQSFQYIAGMSSAPPTSITLGSVSCQPTTRSIGTVCTYSCDSGYVVDGTSQRVVPVTCLSSTASVGVWSRATPTCVLYAEHCPHTMAAPTNGAVNCDGYSLGGICTVSCNAGFRLRGYAPLATVDSVCKADTTWSRPETFYCDPIACPALSLGNGGLNCVGGTIAYNSQCTPYCNAGFTLEGDYTGAVRCNASQLWNATLSAHCQIVSCDPLTLENGAIDCTNGNTNYLSECTPSCNAGYTLGGANTNPVTCQASREWSATLQAECTIVSCDPLTLEHGAVLCTNDNTNYGSECIPSCNPGYSLGGDYADVVECLATREWDRPMDASCTIVACDVLTLPHGTVNCTNNSTDFGSECTVSCAKGYRLTGNYTDGLACTASRTWNATLLAHCEFIEPPSSGSATVTAIGAGAGAGFFLLLLLLLLLLVLARRRRAKKQKPVYETNSSVFLVPGILRQPSTTSSNFTTTVVNEAFSADYDTLQRKEDTYATLGGGGSEELYDSLGAPAYGNSQALYGNSGMPTDDDSAYASPAARIADTSALPPQYESSVVQKAIEAGYEPHTAASAISSEEVAYKTPVFATPASEAQPDSYVTLDEESP